MLFTNVARSLCSVAAGAAALLAASPDAAPAQEPAPFRVESFTLPNGLKVHLVEDHSAQVVAVNVWYDVGSRNERPGRTGFAHLFEHMMFQGSENVGKAEHFQLVERAGGDMNGSTQPDRTDYWEVVPSNRLNLALWLEADRMRSLKVTEENLQNQTEAVKEERRLRVDNQPYMGGFVDSLPAVFDASSCFAYAHSTIGSIFIKYSSKPYWDSLVISSLSFNAVVITTFTLLIGSIFFSLSIFLIAESTSSPSNNGSIRSRLIKS
jgi:hypothetical protein